jgi:hypothetical protein
MPLRTSRSPKDLWRSRTSMAWVAVDVTVAS